MSKRLWWLVVIVAVLAGGVGLAGLPPTQAQGSITVTPNREYINVRLWPALGATVIGSLETGDVMTATGISVSGDWVRIDYFGDEAWVATLVVNASGDLNALPIGDPRTIPYNDAANPSSGGGEPTALFDARLEWSGLRMRMGPSTAYPVVANPPRYAVVSVSGRVASNRWVQISWEGIVGWVLAEHLMLIDTGGLGVPDLPLILPSTTTGARLNDANARQRFLLVDEIRRHLETANATLARIEPGWAALGYGDLPQLCSAPPLVEIYYLTPYDGNRWPDLIEAVATLNQGINDLNNAVQWWVDGCLADEYTAEVISAGQAAVARARNRFDNVYFRLTESRIVQVQAIHAHLNYALDQFNRIEAIWLDAQNGFEEAPPCLNLPLYPTDYALTEWERATYPDLIPLVDRLNEALVVLRDSIRIWDDECQRLNTPGYLIPRETITLGYNRMLEARGLLNAVSGTYLVEAYGAADLIVPAATPTPDLTVQAILHAPYTPTFTPSPTPSFRYSAEAILVASTLHPACTWFGVAGEVLDAEGAPRPATLVHVYGPGVESYILAGSNLNYGAAGFEVPVQSDIARDNIFWVRIEDGFGNPLSPAQRIEFVEDCRLNTAYVTFREYR